jgi:hypothetical protein
LLDLAALLMLRLVKAKILCCHSKFYHPVTLVNAHGSVEKKYFTKRDNKSGLSPQNSSSLYSQCFSISMFAHICEQLLKWRDAKIQRVLSQTRSLMMRDGVCLAKPKLF